MMKHPARTRPDLFNRTNTRPIAPSSSWLQANRKSVHRKPAVAVYTPVGYYSIRFNRSSVK